jgi:hypothetical protein
MYATVTAGQITLAPAAKAQRRMLPACPSMVITRAESSVAGLGTAVFGVMIISSA